MVKKKLITEPEVVIGKLKLIPIAEITTSYYQEIPGLYFFITKKPVAVILITGNEKELLIVDGSGITIDKVLSEMPQLAAILDN